MHIWILIFFFNDTATTEIYTLSLHDALPICIALFALSTLMLGVAADAPALVYAAVAVWGLAFGGAATLLQTAIAPTAGEVAAVAQSMLVTAWNMAIAGGGIVGGLLLARLGLGAVT